MRSELSGVRSSWLMFARNSDLYLEMSWSCSPSPSRLRDASSTSTFLHLEQLRLVVQLGGLGLELRVRLLELLEELVGAHRARVRSCSGMTPTVHQLIEEREVIRVEAAERGELDDRLHVALEEGQAGRRPSAGRLAHAGGDVDEVVRDVDDEDALLLEGALADEALADLVRCSGLLRPPSRTRR